MCIIQSRNAEQQQNISQRKHTLVFYFSAFFFFNETSKQCDQVEKHENPYKSLGKVQARFTGIFIPFFFVLVFVFVLIDAN